MKRVHVALCCAALMALAMFAAPSSAAAAPYGMAGCGLGSIVMGEGGNQILSATTNGTSNNQMFGITSGTSNCVDQVSAAASIDQRAFLRANYASVMRDAAVGQGEYLSALATMLACEPEAHPALFRLTQDKHDAIFNRDAEAALQQIKGLANKDQNLRASCARI